jgi:hypothetical protein
MNPGFARLLVVAPPVFLSLFLGSLGYPLLPRGLACLGLGMGLIVVVARFQRRRSF